MIAYRKNPFVYLLVAVSLAIMACGNVNKPVHAEPGSVLAARFLAAKTVGEAHRVDPVRVSEEPKVQGNLATVKAVFGADKMCVVKLARFEAEKVYGWIVEGMACGSAA
jgi:hypothetical protein